MGAIGHFPAALTSDLWTTGQAVISPSTVCCSSIASRVKLGCQLEFNNGEYRVTATYLVLSRQWQSVTFGKRLKCCCKPSQRGQCSMRGSVVSAAIPRSLTSLSWDLIPSWYQLNSRCPAYDFSILDVSRNASLVSVGIVTGEWRRFIYADWIAILHSDRQMKLEWINRCFRWPQLLPVQLSGMPLCTKTGIRVTA